VRTTVSRSELKKVAKQWFKCAHPGQEVRFMPGFVDRVEDARQQTLKLLRRIRGE
jgi:hypothetical protein